MERIAHLRSQGVAGTQPGANHAKLIAASQQCVPKFNQHRNGRHQFIAVLTGVTSSAHGDRLTSKLRLGHGQVVMIRGHAHRFDKGLTARALNRDDS